MNEIQALLYVQESLEHDPYLKPHEDGVMKLTEMILKCVATQKDARSGDLCFKAIMNYYNILLDYLRHEDDDFDYFANIEDV